jgi:hypothetical protein
MREQRGNLTQADLNADRSQTRGAAAWVNKYFLPKRAGDHTRTADSRQGFKKAASVPCRTKRTEPGQSVPFSGLNVCLIFKKSALRSCSQI